MKQKNEALKIADLILSEKDEHTEYYNYDKYITSFDKETAIKSANQFGTPQYYLDEEALKDRAKYFIDAFQKDIKKSEFYYAFKCNDLPEQIKILKSCGFKADVASLFELKLALKIGFEKIIYTGPGKTKEELSLVLNNSDKVILNIDNMVYLSTHVSGVGLSAHETFSLY